MSEQAQKSSQSVRALSVAEIDTVSGAAHMGVSIPNLGMHIYADGQGYGVDIDNGKDWVSVWVKNPL